MIASWVMKLVSSLISQFGRILLFKAVSPFVLVELSDFPYMRVHGSCLLMSVDLDQLGSGCSFVLEAGGTVFRCCGRMPAVIWVIGSYLCMLGLVGSVCCRFW